MAVRARSLCRWFSSASPTLPYAGNVVSATFPPPIPSPKPTHRPPATISISVLQTGLSSGGQRSSLQPVWERGDLGCGLGRGSRASMNKLQLQHCTFPPVRANVSLFLSAMAQSKCILTADLCPYQHSSAPSLVGLTCQNHTGASGLCVSISGRGAQWHHKSTVQIYLYSVSPAVKMAWGGTANCSFTTGVPKEGHVQRPWQLVLLLWLMVSLSPFSMWHERASPMPDKGGQPMWHKPEANGRSTGND